MHEHTDICKEQIFFHLPISISLVVGYTLLKQVKLAMYSVFIKIFSYLLFFPD